MFPCGNREKAAFKTVTNFASDRKFDSPLYIFGEL